MSDVAINRQRKRCYGVEADNDESVEDSKSEYGYHRSFELIPHLLIPPCTI